ncbi:MAG: DNA polymerase III subunit gamma/tau [Acidimicrobiales bacterium]
MADDVETVAEDAAGEAQDQFVSLYRRFRPGRFAELRGQPHVVRALQGAVRDDRVAHAYLFSGPRGTGKTSTARILARALNCADPKGGEPCTRCRSCLQIARGASLDVHELDAASNNGVDAMRDLIAHAALATPGRWKVYIVDEVHMLSNAAANALLKTLEEPPGHVVFVLATTDPQKVPPTIRSRTQHLEFGLLSADTLADLLRDVNEAAALSLGEPDLSAAVRKGRGSARDALSALDQVVASGSAEALRPEVTGLTGALGEEDARGALVAVAALAEAGWGPQQLATELVDDLRQGFLVALAPELCGATGADRERLAAQATSLGLPRLVRAIETLGRALVDMRDAPDPRAVLEVALVRLARPQLDDSTGAILDRLAHLEQAVSVRGTPPPADGPLPSAMHAPSSPGDQEGRPGFGALRRQRATGSAAPAPPTAAVPPKEPETNEGSRVEKPQGSTAGAVGPDPPDRDAVVQAWGDHVLRSLPGKAKAYYSAGRFVDMEGEVAVFALPNAAHRDRCDEVRHEVEQALTDHFAAPVRLRLAVDQGEVAGRSPPADPEDDFDPGDVEPGSGGPVRSARASAQARLLDAFPGAEEVIG